MLLKYLGHLFLKWYTVNENAFSQIGTWKESEKKEGCYFKLKASCCFFNNVVENCVFKSSKMFEKPLKYILSRLFKLFICTKTIVMRFSDILSFFIGYLWPKAWAKINTVSSTTCHVPCHVICWKLGPKTYRHPCSCANSSSDLSLFVRRREKIWFTKTARKQRCSDWDVPNTVIIQGPEAGDDPKMSDTIPTSFRPMILSAPCHGVGTTVKCQCKIVTLQTDYIQK